MLRIVKIAGGIVLVLAILGVFYYFYTTKEGVRGGEGTEVLMQAPDFSFPDAEGGDIVLSDIEADIRIVNFWASWSPYSKTELPALARVLDEYGDRVTVIALNRDTNPEDGRVFLERLDVGENLLFAYDSGDTYFKKVEGFAVPETLFLDREGNILVHVHGPMNEDEMRSQLTKLLE